MTEDKDLHRQVDLPTGFRADGLYRDTIIELMSEVRDVRRIRSKVMELAEVVAEPPYRATLVLSRPHVSTSRLLKVWELLPRILKPEVADRLSLVIFGGTTTTELPSPLSPALREAIETLINYEAEDFVPIRMKSTAFYDVLRILIVHWFRGCEPLTSKTLGEISGFSYPTIATSLKRLVPYLATHSNRRVELRRFPEQPWREFLALSEGIRETRRYADRSDRQRTFEALIDRLRGEGTSEIAIGGVLGAKHYLPNLDITGIPRLDLTVTARQAQHLDTMIKRLDPALKAAELQEPARVVVHVVRQPQPLFVSDKNGRLWADEVDCLLDLHEAKLDQQANELRSALSARAVR